jgi:hypothetical protein
MSAFASVLTHSFDPRLHLFEQQPWRYPRFNGILINVTERCLAKPVCPFPVAHGDLRLRAKRAIRDSVAAMIAARKLPPLTR